MSFKKQANRFVREINASLAAESLQVGDKVVYGPDPVEQGFPATNRDIGTVIKLKNNRGVDYAVVDYGKGRNKQTYPISEFTIIVD